MDTIELQSLPLSTLLSLSKIIDNRIQEAYKQFVDIPRFEEYYHARIHNGSLEVWSKPRTITTISGINRRYKGHKINHYNNQWKLAKHGAIYSISSTDIMMSCGFQEIPQNWKTVPLIKLATIGYHKRVA